MEKICKENFNFFFFFYFSTNYWKVDKIKEMQMDGKRTRY